MTGVITSSEATELAYRANGGIEVALLWYRSHDFASVMVSDPSSGTFELVIGDGERAMDVFEHPYAYAAMRGLDVGVPSDANELAAAA
jgi:hypothetical protein